MKCVGIISAVGGLGNTTITLSLAKLAANALAIDSNFGFRTFDMVLGFDDVVYDFYDFVKGIPQEKCIFQKDNMNVICSSPSKKVDDFSMEEVREKIFSLDYDYVFIDIPKVEEYINFYTEVCDHFILITKMEDLSIRNLEKIIYLLQKDRKRKQIYILLNRVEETIDCLSESFFHKIGPNVSLVETIPEFSTDKGMEEEEFSVRLSHVLSAMEQKDYEIEPIHKITTEERKKSIFQKIFRIKHE